MALERTPAFRLVERGGAGPSCDAGGIGLGAAALVSLDAGDERYVVRPVDELADVLEAAYGPQERDVIQRCHRGLTRAASALQAGDLALAGIEAVMLRLPEFGVDASVRLAKVADLEKGGDSWRDQPRLPQGQSGGGQWTSGGEGASTAPKVRAKPPGPHPPAHHPGARRQAQPHTPSPSGHPIGHPGDRRAPSPKAPPRDLASTLVDLSNDAAGHLVDAADWLLGPAAHVPVSAEIASGEPNFPMGAAWVETTDPGSLNVTRPVSHLEVGLDVLSIAGALTPAARLAFESGEVRRFSTFEELKAFLGSPGPGNQWHHIVEQTPANIQRFGAEAIHSTDNIVAVPKSLHIGKGSISAYYSSKDRFTGTLTVRQWLSSQSFDAQRAFGIRTLKRYKLWK